MHLTWELFLPGKPVQAGAARRIAVRRHLGVGAPRVRAAWQIARALRLGGPGQHVGCQQACQREYHVFGGSKAAPCTAALREHRQLQRSMAAWAGSLHLVIVLTFLYTQQRWQ